ncbi:MAG: flagellar filament capping protein FliD [Oscillospiraceae bacterium]|nr:flagellar filament capping protein FliD [Oscillospiraceae bacterium]
MRNDRDISNFLNSMRTAIYSKAGANGNTLAQFGINSSSEWKDYGKLEINEEELKNAINTAPDLVTELFTGENGLATKLNTICKNTANVSSANPGTLVKLAGVEGKASEKNNTIQTRLDSIKDKLESLKQVYEQRKARFWKQFNAMETALGNMNSTSGYLTQMLGG